MVKNINAREMALDFIETVFILFLCFGIFYFIVIGGYYSLAEKVVKLVSALFILSLPFAILLKINHKKIHEFRHDGSIDDIIAYAAKKDVIIDLLIIFLITFLIIIIPFFWRIMQGEDLFQAFSTFALMFLWHFIFFHKKDGFGAEIAITRGLKLIDEIYIFFLPVFILIILIFTGAFDIIDLIQSITAFCSMYAWRKYFYYKQT
ncbi:MAG: hypothetical protein U9Q85_00240 [Patescibacteria group bacterium]|nr:hypothetical protein [Patescibacteria group bacterium]